MKTLFSIGTVFAGLVCSSALLAQGPPPQCVAGTLSSYEGDGFNCTVGPDNFDDFHPGGGLNAMDLELTPVTTANGGYGFQLSAVADSGLFTTTETGATYDVYWNLDNIDPGPQASAAQLGMDPPSGDVTIIQDYCNNAIFNSDGVCENGTPQSLTVTSPPCTTDPATDPTHCEANLALNPFLDTAGVKTIIELGASSSFDSLTGTTSNTPEPATWLLGLGGLPAIRLLRRRKV
jgi:MYXO-CTERM domain-containing protein